MKNLGNLYRDGLDVIGKLFEHTGSPDHVFRPTRIVGADVQLIRYRPVDGRLTESASVSVPLQEASFYLRHNGRYTR